MMSPTWSGVCVDCCCGLEECSVPTRRCCLTPPRCSKRCSVVSRWTAKWLPRRRRSLPPTDPAMSTTPSSRRIAMPSPPKMRFVISRRAIAVPEQETASGVLDMLLRGEIRRQDGAWVVARLLGHRVTGSESWQRIKQNWDEVLASVPPQSQRRILDLLPSRSEPDVAADIEAWLADHPLSGGSKAVDQQLELLKVRVGLRAREEGALGDHLRGSA